MIKLIASDLDGTLLLNGAQSLPEEIFPLIRRLKEKGILFAAASGRQYSNMKRLFAPVVSDMVFICENGALAVKDEEVIYQDSFPADLIVDVLNAITEKDGAEFSCSAKDFYYIRPKTQFFYDRMTKVVKTDCRVIRNLSEITEPCMKMAVFERGGMSEESIRYWKERFSDRCTVVTSGNEWVDFIPFGTNKAKGLGKYQELLGIRPEECMVFGDEYNDIEMLKAVPWSFAMAHAKEGVKAAARYETERVEPVLEKLIESDGEMEEVIKYVQQRGCGDVS